MFSQYSLFGQYALKTLGMGLAFAILSLVGRYFFPLWVHPLWFAELGWFIGVSLVIFRLVLPLFSQKPQDLVRKYQKLKWIKLLIFVTFMGSYVWFIKTDALSFLITFMIYYWGFTFLETYQIQRELRKMNN